MRRIYQKPEHHISIQKYATPIVPHENDILLGRGGTNNQHIGNQKLRELARTYCSNYQASSKQGKANLSRQLVQQIHVLNPRGRFLRKADVSYAGGKKKSKNKSEWVEVSDEYAKEKVSQVLRDAISGVKSYQKDNALRDDDLKRQQVESFSTLSASNESMGCSSHFKSEEIVCNVRRPVSAPQLMHSPYQDPLQPSITPPSHYFHSGRRMSSTSDPSPKRRRYQTTVWERPLTHEIYNPLPGRYSFRAAQRQSLPPIPTSPLIPNQVAFEEQTCPPSLLQSLPSHAISPNRSNQSKTYTGLDEFNLLNCELFHSDDEEPAMKEP
mmetsp:Transcript_22263/g.33781  ORF Transcript_22263/g.33781 Transcript_22263/m.33781 type:complete len:325 (-) Transcript_22263:212-1186(-)